MRVEFGSLGGGIAKKIVIDERGCGRRGENVASLIARDPRESKRCALCGNKGNDSLRCENCNESFHIFCLLHVVATSSPRPPLWTAERLATREDFAPLLRRPEALRIFHQLNAARIDQCHSSGNLVSGSGNMTSRIMISGIMSSGSMRVGTKSAEVKALETVEGGVALKTAQSIKPAMPNKNVASTLARTASTNDHSFQGANQAPDTDVNHATNTCVSATCANDKCVNRTRSSNSGGDSAEQKVLDQDALNQRGMNLRNTFECMWCTGITQLTDCELRKCLLCGLSAGRDSLTKCSTLRCTQFVHYSCVRVLHPQALSDPLIRHSRYTEEDVIDVFLNRLLKGVQSAGYMEDIHALQKDAAQAFAPAFFKALDAFTCPQCATERALVTAKKRNSTYIPACVLFRTDANLLRLHFAALHRPISDRLCDMPIWRDLQLRTSQQKKVRDLAFTSGSCLSIPFKSVQISKPATSKPVGVVTDLLGRGKDPGNCPEHREKEKRHPQIILQSARDPEAPPASVRRFLPSNKLHSRRLSCAPVRPLAHISAPPQKKAAIRIRTSKSWTVTPNATEDVSEDRKTESADFVMQASGDTSGHKCLEEEDTDSDLEVLDVGIVKPPLPQQKAYKPPKPTKRAYKSGSRLTPGSGLRPDSGSGSASALQPSTPMCRVTMPTVADKVLIPLTPAQEQLLKRLEEQVNLRAVVAFVFSSVAQEFDELACSDMPSELAERFQAPQAKERQLQAPTSERLLIDFVCSSSWRTRIDRLDSLSPQHRLTMCREGLKLPTLHRLLLIVYEKIEQVVGRDFFRYLYISQELRENFTLTGTLPLPTLTKLMLLTSPSSSPSSESKSPGMVDAGKGRRRGELATPLKKASSRQLPPSLGPSSQGTSTRSSECSHTHPCHTDQTDHHLESTSISRIQTQSNSLGVGDDFATSKERQIVQICRWLSSWRSLLLHDPFAGDLTNSDYDPSALLFDDWSVFLVPNLLEHVLQAQFTACEAQLVIDAGGREFKDDSEYHPCVRSRQNMHLSKRCWHDEVCYAVFKIFSRFGIFPPLRFLTTPAYGFFVVARDDIAAGTILGEYSGVVEPVRWNSADSIQVSAVFDSIYDLPSKSLAPSALLAIVPEPRTNLMRFVLGVNNDAKDAAEQINVHTIPINFKAHWSLFVVALKKIPKGFPLTLNYNAGEVSHYPTTNFA